MDETNIDQEKICVFCPHDPMRDAKFVEGRP